MTDAPYVLTTADRVEIHELPGRYGDSIDDRNWPALDAVFTKDALFDLTGVGSRICDGIDDIKSFMESEAAHPRTHMMTNIYADSEKDGVTPALSHRRPHRQRTNFNRQLLRQDRQDRGWMADPAPIRLNPTSR